MHGPHGLLHLPKAVEMICGEEQVIDGDVLLVEHSKRPHKFCVPGRILGQGPARGEAVVVAEIDLKEIGAERAREPALHTRLPDLYEAE
jgi:predicted amidohydrolase